MNDTLNQYLDEVIARRMYTTRGNLRFHMETLFEGIDLEDKRVIDIGGGSGLYSFYAAARGAAEVVCLEPEADGSRSGITDRFRQLSASLQLQTVTLERETLQSFQPGGRKFDVVLMYNSINHLNEEACITLLRDAGSRAIYREILAKIAVLSSPNAWLIICDCSRHNFFATLGLRNPIAGSIEWSKHQAPEEWIKLLQEVGFGEPCVRWSSFNSLRRLGRVLTGNKLASYFLVSHFCLRMRKS